MLFDPDVHRVDTEPAGYAEPHFAYLNRTARSDAAAVRSVLEAWFTAYPDAAKAELRARFRSPDRYPHYSAFFELYTHALLSRLGLRVDVHVPGPGVAAVRAPDFRVTPPAEPVFCVEATLATNVSTAEMAAEARLNQVYDALNGTDSPNFFIGVHVHGTPAQPVPGRALRKLVEEFFRDLDPDRCTELIREGGLDAVPKLQAEIHGWRIDISPFPKSPASRGKPGIRPLGMTGPAEASWIDDSTALRDAVITKAARYGDLGCPFVVAVNAVNQHLDMTDAMEALFGKESYTIPIVDGRSGEPVMHRLPNGAWQGAGGPINTRVSAVIVASSIVPWSVTAYTPEVYHNPHARYPLGGHLDRLPHYRAEGNRMVAHAGVGAADLFQLPVGWPRSGDVGAV